MIRPITWTGESVRLLDQTKLPRETVYVDITDERQMHDAIRRLVVRGAPAIGIAAAYGVYLGVRRDPARLGDVCDYLATSRPTAVNLFWAIERMQERFQSAIRQERDALKLRKIMLNEALAIEAEDRAMCQAIGACGADLVSDGGGVLTHC